MRKTTDYFSSTTPRPGSDSTRLPDQPVQSLEELPVDGFGPAGEPLSISVARLGSPTASHVLLHTSGIHGVEGFVGSALQLQLLAEPPEIPPHVAIVIIHVVNPYGMAWLRRMNANNVDLNRNFRREGEFTGASAMYRHLNTWLNPEGPPRHIDAFYLRAVWCVMRYGVEDPRQAIGEGQYSYPRGLFYGGKRLEQESRLILNWVRRDLSFAHRIVSIDVHSGLGPYGIDSLLVDYPAASDRGQVLGRMFGDQMKFDHGSGVAYRVKGSYLEALERTLPQAEWCSLTQEYGTYGVLRMLKSLRDENRYHHFSSHFDASHPSKRAFLQAFCPDDPAWRQEVLNRSRTLVERALKLAFEPSMPWRFKELTPHSASFSELAT